MQKKFFLAMLLSGLVLFRTVQAEMLIPAAPLWKPVKDQVYLQETSRHVVTPTPLTAVAVFQERVYAGSAQGVFVLEGDALKPVVGPAAVSRLEVLKEHLWAVSPEGLWRTDGGPWRRILEGGVVDLCLHEGAIIVARPNALEALDAAGEAVDAQSVWNATSDSAILGVESYAGTLYTHTGARLGVLYQGSLQYDQVADWGSMPKACAVRDMLAQGSRLYVATDKGLALLRGMTWYALTGEDGLCYEDTTSLSTGFAEDLWVGTTRGAIRSTDGAYHYFGAQRWLPNGKVNAIACGASMVCVATDGGLGIIGYEPYTLQKKADWYENWMEEWGMKRLGFTHMLVWDAQTGEWIREVSDNDVGFSSHYFDALCFKYAVTKDPKVRAEALDMMKSMKWSEEITSIDGYPARSIWAVGERGLQAQHGSGGLPAEWHLTPDGQWQWKGDTSSDEVDAHFYTTSLFLELVAKTEDEREMAKDHLRKLMGYIIDSGWCLRDVDGEPTRWARWDMDYFHTKEGMAQWGLNGLEAMSFVTNTLHFTGDEKFAAGKKQLLEWGYQDHALRQKLTFHPGYFCHFDDRLAFYAYYPLMRYETDPRLQSLWRMSLERSWEVKRIEGVPWFHFIYGALTGNDCEEKRAVAHLREWPLDMRLYSYQNAHRSDLHTPAGYRMYTERIRPLSPRETGGMRWDSDFMQLDNFSGGNIVCDPAGWLDAYWMGRYYGMITAPESDKPELVSYPRTGRQLGAKPYAGPARPKVWKE